MSSRGLPVTIVNACLRDGRGGSPTAVLDETALSDSERRKVPELLGTSHAVFVSMEHDGPGRPSASLRFFTSEGELPACGHGTVAALAFLAERAGGAGGTEHRMRIRVSGRAFTGRSFRNGSQITAVFDPGPVDLREPTAAEREPVLAALGVTADTLAAGIRVASLGRPRLLVPVSTRSVLATLAPDLDRLRDACDRLGLLGCYVHSIPTADGRLAARMFAPSIGVVEDIANANSTACLAAHLAGHGITDITVDMGDALGSPSTITATAQQSPTGPVISVGGTATLKGLIHRPWE
ncbi:PhzF family phenazine biosynthesis protein [Microtetraspora glauca]|uniref:PhzF family phenazine biosynthesis isomerase n=1 Tax=Microtetraspora glauca TaxID=1996 RepID=A0ABV3GQK1_MICGL